MLKHCVATADGRRSRATECASLNSSAGNSSFNSSVGADSLNNTSASSSSSEDGEPLSMVSRASSYASLSVDAAASHNHGPKTPIKIFAKCLRPDIEYKTLSVGGQTTSKELIWMLLSKYKMRHRDPNLFYLTMDISIKRTGIPLKRTLILDDDARPAELKQCHPWGECKFTLQVRKGGLVRIHDSVLMAESKYKCLLIAEHTTVEEVISILFHCYGLERIERVERYCVYEQCQSRCYERRLHPKDRPAQVQSLWPATNQFVFVLRRNNDITPVSVSIPEVMDVSYAATDSSSSSSTSADSPVPSSSLSSSSSEASSSTSSSLPSSVFAPQTPPDNIKFSLLHQQHQQPMVYRRRPMVAPHFNYANNNVNRSATGTPISIHESGLPPPPALRPKPVGVLGGSGAFSLSVVSAASNRTSVGSLSSGSRSSAASFHEYENYFYI